MNFRHFLPFLRTVAALCLLLVSMQRTASAQERVLAVGDTVGVSVYDELDLEVKAPIDNTGKITLKLAGEIKIAGLTPTNAARAIENAYKAGYLVNPSVTVTTLGMARRKFSIGGAVTKPGTFQFGATDNVSLLQAIALAGGYTNRADPADITVTRTGKDGRTSAIKLDAKKMAKDGAAPFQVQDGDTIHVDESVF